jgi:hypothetical protein
LACRIPTNLPTASQNLLCLIALMNCFLHLPTKQTTNRDFLLEHSLLLPF